MIFMTKNIIKKIVSKWNQQKAKKHQLIFQSGFSAFSDLSKNNYVKNIIFEEGEAIISLNDGRRYFFNPNSKVNTLYTVPQIGTFEPNETAMVKKLVKEGDYCLDIGGSFGWYTVLLSQIVGEHGKVFSFEPVRQNFESHVNNIELNNCNNVISNNLAVGEIGGEIKIYLSDIDTSGSLKLRKYNNNYEVQNVKIIRLDDYFKGYNIKRLDFIKIDIEGAELGAFKGAENILKNHKPTLFVEIQRHSTELFGYEPIDIFCYLYDFGYESFVINNGRLEKFAFMEPLTDYNFFFKHTEKN